MKITATSVTIGFVYLSIQAASPVPESQPSGVLGRNAQAI